MPSRLTWLIRNKIEKRSCFVGFFFYGGNCSILGSKGRFGRRADSRCVGEEALPSGQRVVFALAQGATAPPALRVVVGALQKEGAPVCIKPLQPGFARGKCAPPFGGWRHHLSPASGGTIKLRETVVSNVALSKARVVVPPLLRGEGGAVGTKGGKSHRRWLIHRNAVHTE